ncbi:hypothetical protein UCREL1_6367 [Eutypa lata UCREL1]|uniref:Uncharacterized protein n=1 Tax=Eutypa lata (strain UCR-EL1) TaxID=1287681 RepID=M7SR09_EUTLA|nr:hypothetical protein UCREL1_6367 [Eutypa lata UCREL1]
MSTTGKWQDPKLLKDLSAVLFTVLGPIPTDKQETVVTYLQERGHNIGWEAIRTTIFLSSPGAIMNT